MPGKMDGVGMTYEGYFEGNMEGPGVSAGSLPFALPPSTLGSPVPSFVPQKADFDGPAQWALLPGFPWLSQWGAPAEGLTGGG